MAHPDTQVTQDQLDPARARALQVALGYPATLEAGAPLPPFFHQVYFWAPVAAPFLGPDGHPKTGGLVPDFGLPRRMWAGGRLRFDAPLRCGQPAEKRTSLRDAQRKEGRSGPLAFVTLCHEIWQDGKLCVTEEQDLVYREAADPDAPAPRTRPAPVNEDDSHRRDFDSTLLFRYSALTFNGHRIHYDADYARAREGYDGLVVHGPLLAQLLMLQAKDHLGGLARFSFRATAPLIAGEMADFCRAGASLWVRGADGRLCLEAEAA